MADPLALLEKIGAPVVTGLTGFVGAALNFKRRIDDLEKEFNRHKDAVKEELTSLKAAWKAELEWVEGDLRKDFDELKDELKELGDTFGRFQRGSMVDFADAGEVQRFVEEQERQWQKIQRTLGRIEGLMQQVDTTTSSEPPRPLPRPRVPGVPPRTPPKR